MLALPIAIGRDSLTWNYKGVESFSVAPVRRLWLGHLKSSVPAGSEGAFDRVQSSCLFQSPKLLRPLCLVQERGSYPVHRK
jgi:hypothetical protein